MTFTEYMRREYIIGLEQSDLANNIQHAETLFEQYINSMSNFELMEYVSDFIDKRLNRNDR